MGKGFEGQGKCGLKNVKLKIIYKNCSLMNNPSFINISKGKLSMHKRMTWVVSIIISYERCSLKLHLYRTRNSKSNIMVLELTSGSPRLCLYTLFKSSKVFHLLVVHSINFVCAKRFTFSVANVHCKIKPL